MARDHERTNLDIWGDDDWMDLSPQAQHLYFVLKTDPDLSYCGSSEWHPGRIAARAKGWTAAAVEEAAAELSGSAGLFLIVDTVSEEYLLRSWIKHDGLWKIPNMAVSMANARAALASRTLRGVVVHEVRKLAKHHPELGSWERDTVVKMLAQRAVDPAELDAFTPTATPALTPVVTPNPTPAVTPPLTLNEGVGVNPPANPGPTPSPTPTPFPQDGYVSPVGHQDPQPDPTPEPPVTRPPDRCTRHRDATGTVPACRPCEAARHAAEDWDRDHREAQARATIARRREIRDCPDCDDNGWTGDPDEGLTRCSNHTWDAPNA